MKFLKISIVLYVPNTLTRYAIIQEIGKFGSADLISGVFTCAVPGLYKFQVYSLTKSNTKLFLELKLNNVVVATLWGYTVGDYAAAGNAVILQLEEGDTVWVQTRDDVAVDLYGTSEEIYTTFTGLQLSSLWNQEGTSVRSWCWLGSLQKC